MLQYFSATNEARVQMSTIEPNEIMDGTVDYEHLKKLLRDEFRSSSDEERSEAEKDFFNCARRYGEMMKQYVRRSTRLKKRWNDTEPDTNISDRRYAKMLLRRSGLSRVEQKQVLVACEMKYDSDAIKAALLKIYDDAHKADRGRLAAGKNRGRFKTYYANFTEMHPSDVERSDECMDDKDDQPEILGRVW